MLSGRHTDSAGLAPDAFLTRLRVACRRWLKADAANDLRSACDLWTIDPNRVDPLEPLINSGRRTLSWPSDVWSAISSDLINALRRATDADAPPLPAALAEYAAFTHLELAANEEPRLGPQPDALVLPLVISARERASSTEFRLYVLAWHARAAQHPWNNPEMAFTASLVIALGSTEDPELNGRVHQFRDALTEGAVSGRARFRDHVRPHQRPWWTQAARAAAPDARQWAEGFMR